MHTLQLAGELDFLQRGDLSELLLSLEAADVAVLDFSHVTFVDASVIGCLAVLQKRMRKNGGAGIVRIIEPPPPLVKILTICGLNTVFEICEPGHSIASAAAKQSA